MAVICLYNQLTSNHQNRAVSNIFILISIIERFFKACRFFNPFMALFTCKDVLQISSVHESPSGVVHLLLARFLLAQIPGYAQNISVFFLDLYIHMEEDNERGVTGSTF